MHPAYETEIVAQIAESEGPEGVLHLTARYDFPLDADALELLLKHQAMGRLKRIKKIDLKNEGLDARCMALLSRLLTGVTGLKCLELWGNPIQDDGVEALFECAASGALLDLEELQLDHTEFGERGMRALSRAAKHMPRLQTLDLVGIEIDDGSAHALADASTYLCSLRFLNCIGTKVIDREARLRKALCVEPFLSTLGRVVFGQLGNIPVEALHSEYPSVLRRFIEPQGTAARPLARAKVVILGQGHAGKTHLRKRVFERLPEYFNAAEPRTDDFQTSAWTSHYHPVAVDKRSRLPTEGGSSAVRCRLGVWDFGGQPSLHSTHRLFLTDRRCVFIVVCDATKTRNENRLDYWLGLIANEASPLAPVAIVITKCDLYNSEADRQGVRRLEAIDAFTLRQSAGLAPESPLAIIDGVGWHPACADSRVRKGENRSALANVETAVAELVAHVLDIDVQYPVAMCDVVNWVCNEAFWGRCRSFITIEKFQAVCAKCGLDPSLWDVALDLVVNLGAVHSVRQRLGVRRGDRISHRLFSPEWLRGPVYRVISASSAPGHRGMLSWEELEALLPDHVADPHAIDYWRSSTFTAQERVDVIDVMCAYELMFEVHRGNRPLRYFVPDHLQPRSANEIPDGEHVWVREFKWLPEVAFGRLLGRLHQQAERDPSALWRDEIALKIGRSNLMVRVCDPLGTVAEGRSSSVGVYVAVSNATEKDAARMLDVVDIELRAVLGEPALGLGLWKELTQRAAPLPSNVNFPRFAIGAARVFDEVRSVCERSGLVVSSWEDVVAVARKVAAVDARMKSDSDLVGAILDAERDVERFARYCRRAGRRAWWSNRGKQKRY